jgi:hypothetical protein
MRSDRTASWTIGAMCSWHCSRYNGGIEATVGQACRGHAVFGLLGRVASLAMIVCRHTTGPRLQWHLPVWVGSRNGRSHHRDHVAARRARGVCSFAGQVSVECKVVSSAVIPRGRCVSCAQLRRRVHRDRRVDERDANMGTIAGGLANQFVQLRHGRVQRNDRRRGRAAALLGLVDWSARVHNVPFDGVDPYRRSLSLPFLHHHHPGLLLSTVP